MRFFRRNIKSQHFSFIVLFLGLTYISGSRGSEHPSRIGVTIDSETKKFSDKRLPKDARIVGVKIRHALMIDSVELLYQIPGQSVRSLGKHGGLGGKEEIFILEEGEFIRGITGSYGSVVDSLVIVTNKRESKQFGGKGGNVRFEFVTPRDEVVGFFGQSGDLVDRIGVLVVARQVDPDDDPAP